MPPVVVGVLGALLLADLCSLGDPRSLLTVPVLAN